jgi:hypothetical protein
MIKEIENWYLSNCNGDWEHQYGVTIESLDNPGWRVFIDLTGTKLEQIDFEEINNIESESEWIVCKVENNKFIGADGPHNLNEILSIFINWGKVNKAL